MTARRRMFRSYVSTIATDLLEAIEDVRSYVARDASAPD